MVFGKIQEPFLYQLQNLQNRKTKAANWLLFLVLYQNQIFPRFQIKIGLFRIDIVDFARKQFSVLSVVIFSINGSWQTFVGEIIDG